MGIQQFLFSRLNTNKRITTKHSYSTSLKQKKTSSVQPKKSGLLLGFQQKEVDVSSTSAPPTKRELTGCCAQKYKVVAGSEPL